MSALFTNFVARSLLSTGQNPRRSHPTLYWKRSSAFTCRTYPQFSPGPTMNRILLCLLSSSLILSMYACSGLPKTSGGGGGTGNATLSLTLRATPPSPSANLSILTLRATVTGVSLTPSSGSAVSVGLVSGNSSSYAAEFTRLQSDSALLSAAVSVPAGTYNSVAVTFSDVLLTYCTQPSSGVAGCSSGSLTQVTGSPGATTASSGAFPLTVTSGEKLGECEYPERYHCERPDHFSGKSRCRKRAHCYPIAGTV